MSKNFLYQTVSFALIHLIVISSIGPIYGEESSKPFPTIFNIKKDPNRKKDPEELEASKEMESSGPVGLPGKVARNIVWPGWGQAKEEDSWKGRIFPWITLGVSANALYALGSYGAAQNDYKENAPDFGTAILFSTLTPGFVPIYQLQSTEAGNKLSESATRLEQAGQIYTAWWIICMADLLIFHKGSVAYSPAKKDKEFTLLSSDKGKLQFDVRYQSDARHLGMANSNPATREVRYQAEWVSEPVQW